MADDTNILLKVYEMQWGYMRQMEDHRVQITNIVLLITSAIMGFIGQRGLSFDVLPLTELLIALGIYGAIVASKQYERWDFFRERLEAMERRFDQAHPGLEINKLWQEANDIHVKHFARLSKIRLHQLWIVLHLAIAAAGVILTLIIVVVR
jgi:hypothetical protein